MDTLTHALIGTAVAGFSGHMPSVHDPIYIAVMLGAQAPDFDIITQLRGSFTYVKQHRSMSHSLPGISLSSLLIAGVIYCITPQVSFLSLFLWAFAGCLSHIIIDYFNTHGVAILWPFIRERKCLPLFHVFDPVLLSVLAAIQVVNISVYQQAWLTTIVLIIYGLIRLYLRKVAQKRVSRHFAHQQIQRIITMPSIKRLLFWDFVIETSGDFIVGHTCTLSPQIAVKKQLQKPTDGHSIMQKASKTFIGHFFSTFTPFLFYEKIQDGTKVAINMYDLRYLIDKKFRHSATVIFNTELTLIDAYMLSYGRKIKVPC